MGVEVTRFSAFPWWLVAALAAGCRSTTTASPTKDPPVASVAARPSTPDAGTVTAAPPPRPTMPTLVREPFAPAGGTPTALFAIEGALAVTDGLRVGRIAGDGVEWLGKIPKVTTTYGTNSVVGVTGRYPDSVSAYFETSEGRAPAPTYFVVTGKGKNHTEAGGGGWGNIFAARVGDSTILAVASIYESYRLVTVRGPRLDRKLTLAAATCKPGEVSAPFGVPQTAPALAPSAFEATTAGTLVSIGTLCGKRGPTAEIWDKAGGASKLVDLGPAWKKASYRVSLLKGSGDELWAFSDPWQPILHYAGGAFTAIPLLAAPVEQVFVAPNGQLHARTSSQTIHRFADGQWSAVGRLTEPLERRVLAVDADGALWTAGDGKVFKLREGPKEPADDACASWFVYLFEASDRNGPTYTYPTTRKALATFPEAARLGLVEFGGYPRHLGVTVTSKAQGEAVITHLNASMPSEDPKLFCHVPLTPRRIDLDAKP